MRKTILLAVITLTAILPMCAQDKLAELRRTLTEHYSNDAEKQRAAAWLFGKPVAVAKIKYLPRNDDNHVTAGHRYRLDYYYRDGAHTVGEQTATTDSVTFVNVPTGALYILHDLTKGKEERIFNFENGMVRWW